MKVGAFLQCEMNSISKSCSQVASALLQGLPRKQYRVVTLLAEEVHDSQR